jgi:site-specific recombinase XerC
MRIQVCQQAGIRNYRYFRGYGSSGFPYYSEPPFQVVVSATNPAHVREASEVRQNTMSRAMVVWQIDGLIIKEALSEQLLQQTPDTVNRTVTPKRPPNSKLRTREYLTEAEVERLMKAATRNRWGHRDSTMVFVAYRHGLRASEVVDLRWEDQVEFKTANLHVRRVKQGTPSTHPILGDELRALRRLKREQESKSPFVFTSERGAPFSPAGFARMLERAGALAKLGFKAHPSATGLSRAQEHSAASSHDAPCVRLRAGQQSLSAAGASAAFPACPSRTGPIAFVPRHSLDGRRTRSMAERHDLGERRWHRENHRIARFSQEQERI